ncbi:MAG: tetratricopeptide repeat protein [Caldisericia bacterium]|nr:tetratricopeptide repeat protein [Caldisericia bacterium]
MEQTVQELLHKANINEKHKNWNNAIVDLEKARVLDPNNKTVNISLSRIYMIVGDPIKGLELILSVDEDKKDSDYLLQLSNIYLTMQRFKDAKIVLEKALDIKSTAPLYNNLAVVMMRMNNGEEAVKYLFESLKINDTNPNTYFNLATYYESKNDISKAEKVLQKAHSKCETSEIDDKLIKSLLRLKKVSDAKTLLEDALGKFPNSEALQIDKVKILIHGNEFENALMYIKEVSSKDSLSSNFERVLLDLKSDALVKLARFDQAVAILDHILLSPGANPIYYLKKANILTINGNHKEAVKLLATALGQNKLPVNLQHDAILMMRDIEIANWQKFAEFMLIDISFKDDVLSNPIYALESRGIVLPHNNIQRVIDIVKKQHPATIQTEQGIS